MTDTQSITLYPNPKWYISKSSVPTLNNDFVHFPKLYYYKVDKLNDIIPENLVIGGSHNIYAQLPMYFTRCEIFEKNFMPYNLDTLFFKVRNGILLWPRINLYAYTDMTNPQCVYIKKNNRYVAKIIFSPNDIQLYEVCINENGENLTNAGTFDITNANVRNITNIENNCEKMDITFLDIV